MTPRRRDELLMVVLRSRRAAGTRAAYMRDLALFLTFCEQRGQAPYAARAVHVEDYLGLLAARGLTDASRARALAAISACYRRAVHEGAVSANPCEFVARPQPAAQKQNQARSISRAQATALLAAAHRRSPLHELLVCLLFCNGLRAGEAAAADLEDLGEHDGHRVLRVRGKGEIEKNLRVPLNAPTLTALARWPPEPKRIAGAAPTAGPLLVSPRTGRRLTRQAIYGLIGRLAHAADVGELSPHGLRRRWSRSRSTPGCRCATSRMPRGTPTREPPADTTATATASTATPRCATPRCASPSLATLNHLRRRAGALAANRRCTHARAGSVALLRARSRLALLSRPENPTCRERRTVSPCGLGALGRVRERAFSDVSGRPRELLLVIHRTGNGPQARTSRQTAVRSTGWYVAITTPVVAVLVSTSRRFVAGVPSAKSLLPDPSTNG
jgi:integrase/recombinase XerD